MIFKEDNLEVFIKGMASYQTNPIRHPNCDVDLVLDRVRSVLQKYVGLELNLKLLDEMRDRVHKAVNAAMSEMNYDK